MVAGRLVPRTEASEIPKKCILERSFDPMKPIHSTQVMPTTRRFGRLAELPSAQTENSLPNARELHLIQAKGLVSRDLLPDCHAAAAADALQK
jgi:hypothetical protein